MRKLSKQLKDCCYGIDYSLNAIKAMDASHTHFSNLQELITNSLFYKQQLDYEESVRFRVRAKELGERPVSEHSPRNATSARSKFAQRFSGSFDLHSSLISSSFGNMANSASVDLKDIKSAFSQFASSSPTVKTAPPPPFAAPSTSTQHEEPPQEREEPEMKY